MDYEKLYKEALERARTIVKNKNASSVWKDCLRIIFPEFKESKNERIRKDCIRYLDREYQHCSLNEDKTKIEKCIAWLEKQDSHYTFEIKKGYWYKCVCDYMLNGSDLIFKNGRLYYCRKDWRLGSEIDERNVKDIGVNGYKSFFRPATNREIKDWLEKQGEKDILEDAVVDSNDDGLIAETIKYKNEQKPADKVKLKFKVGDKINKNDKADEEYYILTITSIDIEEHCYLCNQGSVIDFDEQDMWHVVKQSKFKVGNWYQCTKDFLGKGVTFDKDTAYYCAKEGCLQSDYGCHVAIVKDLYDNFKLWTLEDAKEGDVLSDGTTIFIFKDLLSDSSVMSYCDYDTGTSENDAFCPLSVNLVCSKIHPATKEQHETLFKAMTDAGYEWDAKKKELKKIEEEPENYKQQVMSEMTDLIIDYIRQKNAWGEEDELHLRDAINAAKELYSPDCGGDELVDWLKSLKERIKGE